MDPTSDLVNAGHKWLEELQRATDAQLDWARRYGALRVSDWIVEARASANAPPTFLQSLTGGHKNADYYTQRLKGVRQELDQLRPLLMGWPQRLADPERQLGLSGLALQAFEPMITDPTLKIVVSNRLRVLLTARLSARQLVQTIENSLAVVLTDIGTLDQLLTTTLPNWALANSRRK